MVHHRRAAPMLFFSAIFVGVLVYAEVKDEKTEKTEKMKHRLEQLFVWRVSDRLQLNPDEEAKFSLEFKKLSEERQGNMQKMDSLLDEIDHSRGDKKKISKLLGDYEAIVKRNGNLQTREFQVMSKVFDKEKMAEYVLLKHEMTQRFKDVLSQSSQPGADRPMKEPSVIQEK